MATRIRKKRSDLRCESANEVATTAALVTLAREAESTPGVLRVRMRAGAVANDMRRVLGYDWDPPQTVKLDLIGAVDRGYVLMIVRLPAGTLTPEILWRLNEARRQVGLPSLSHPWTVLMPIDDGVAHLMAEAATIGPETPTRSRPAVGELF